MTASKSLRASAIIFFLGRLSDTIGGVIFAVFGTASIEPPTHRFYALFLASSFFALPTCQILSAFNMRRYLLSVGCVFIGRIFYLVLLYAYIFGVAGFPNTFSWTGLVDLSWSILYVVITLMSDEIRSRDLFLPNGERVDWVR